MSPYKKTSRLVTSTLLNFRWPENKRRTWRYQKLQHSCLHPSSEEKIFCRSQNNSGLILHPENVCWQTLRRCMTVNRVSRAVNKNSWSPTPTHLHLCLWRLWRI